MLTQEELAFIKVLSSNLVREMKSAVAARGTKERPAIPAWIHSTAAGGVSTTSQRLPTRAG
jgi:hypothetical protein